MLLIRFLRFIIISLIACFGLSCDASELRVPAMFSDHMVLQKSERAAVWGWAGPGERVVVTFGEERAQAEANAEGRWLARLDLSAVAKEPGKLIIRSANDIITLDDIVVGQVWLTSGQSNMEFRLQKSLGSEKAIAQSQNPALRLFAVEETASLEPQEDCEGRWQVASPETTGPFSAISYYFARVVQEELDCPVGIINASVGGTMIEAWTSLEALSRNPALKEGASRNRAEALALEVNRHRYAEALTAWTERTGRADVPTSPEPYLSVDDASVAWSSIKLMGRVSNEPATVWIRREVDLPADRTDEPLTLILEKIQGFDTVYWNGHHVGSYTLDDYRGWNAPREYTVPVDWLRAGKNSLAVRIYSPDEPIVIKGKNKRFRAGPVRLSGVWQLAVERAFEPLGVEERASVPEPIAYFEPKSRAASLYNGMIHPLMPYTLAGILWYQGESNAKRAWQYREALPLLIEDWREGWGRHDIPFLFCQLPKYRPSRSQCPEGGWAVLREAQSLTAAQDPYAWRAVLIDLGEELDIHPRNKLDPALRLAAIALAEVYGKECVASGPVFESATFAEGSATIRFRQAEGGLIASPLPETYEPSSSSRETKPLPRNRLGSELEGFALCGSDGQWHWADARITGEDTVVVRSPQVADPVAVRYAWSDFPVCNLTNAAGLPAEPFRTDSFPVVTRDVQYGLTDPDAERE